MKNIIVLLCVIMLCSNSCEKPPFVDYFYDIIVTNSSRSDIRVYLADEFAIRQYPDTTLPEIKLTIQKAPIGKNCYFYSKTSWEENLTKLSADTLSVYFIDNTVYENGPWDSIRTNYLILQRYDLSLKDLQNRNFEIEYPYDVGRGILKVWKP